MSAEDPILQAEGVLNDPESKYYPVRIPMTDVKWLRIQTKKRAIFLSALLDVLDSRTDLPHYDQNRDEIWAVIKGKFDAPPIDLDGERYLDVDLNYREIKVIGRALLGFDGELSDGEMAERQGVLLLRGVLEARRYLIGFQGIVEQFKSRGGKDSLGYSNLLKRLLSFDEGAVV